MVTAKDIQTQLEGYSTPEKRDFLPYFFKTGEGQYGEGDKFIGVVVPDTRKVAKANKLMPVDEIEKLLQSQYHECRLCALLILVELFKGAKKDEKKKIVDFYLANTERINNWDLVDLSARDIVGEYLADKTDRSVLYNLAASSLLWNQRIAIISTFAFIKQNDFEDTVRLSEIFLTHKHDLMHKATGWMLREAGKRDKEVLIAFLDKHYRAMPRTMLRYAIEKLSPEERAHYMKKD
ncbi:3-methyladenine DNA glycosylase AlkD [Dysgonomonas sp. PH5-45]|uniref:DNA alkylation repair protein n=1 Tax=unclassified Dysgonomonas TaxID=2630389 RepID=UPI002472E859|nr:MULTISPECIES: DNA alkylation repair protein [unclassified Dysgonomonas]MDH6353730.1 3-methyladenine DNA glycosylase AlkD [Dysgonomonas sp. PH5-45]MDH6386633.1 3-methyladenine DNA glycosylase AlkD [Dysgonomonas sp. PH5-37]